MIHNNFVPEHNQEFTIIKNKIKDRENLLVDSHYHFVKGFRVT